MTTMNISLPERLKKFVDEQVDQAGYGSSSEYVRELIRRDRVAAAKRQLAAMMREGLESGDGSTVDRQFWAKKKAALRRRK